MKHHTSISWTITGLMAALMLLSAVPDVLRVPGALYSHLSVGDPPSAWMPAGLALALLGSSYVAYRLRIGGDGLSRESQMATAKAVIASQLPLNT